jgi:hypothetical protein
MPRDLREDLRFLREADLREARRVEAILHIPEIFRAWPKIESNSDFLGAR